MLVVETIAKIGRAYFSLGKPIKEICRELLLIAQGRTEGDLLATEFPLSARRPTPAENRALARAA